MNKMKEVAELLRVNLEEKFKIKGSKSTFWITEQGFFEHNNWIITCQDTEKILVKILLGEYEIIREPFVPEEGQEFWYCNFNDEYAPLHEKFDNDCVIHRIIVNKQLAFRSKEEVFDYLTHIESQMNKEREKKR